MGVFVIKVQNNTKTDFYLDVAKVTHLRDMGPNTAVFLGGSEVIVALPVRELMQKLEWDVTLDCSNLDADAELYDDSPPQHMFQIG